jgi:hypothetical protein
MNKLALDMLTAGNLKVGLPVLFEYPDNSRGIPKPDAWNDHVYELASKQKLIVLDYVETSTGEANPCSCDFRGPNVWLGCRCGAFKGEHS